MRAFVRWLQYRDAVLGTLDAILLAYPRNREFKDDFPKLTAEVRASFDEGVLPNLAALRTAQAIVTQFVQQLDRDKKALVLDRLVAGGRSGFAELAAGRLGGVKTTTSEPVVFVTQLTGIAIFMAGRLTENSAIGHNDYDRFLTKIASELGANAASEQRLKDSFHHS